MTNIDKKRSVLMDEPVVNRATLLSKHCSRAVVLGCELVNSLSLYVTDHRNSLLQRLRLLRVLETAASLNMMMNNTCE